MIALGLLIAAFPLLVILSIRFFLLSQISSIKDEKTGKTIPYAPLLLFWKSMLEKADFRKTLYELSKTEDVFVTYFAHRAVVLVNTPELAKQILFDTKTFPKFFVQITNEGERFIGRNNVAVVNGDVWKRQREVINPAFYNIDVYFDIFKDKVQQILNKFEKSIVVQDVKKFMQEMTLDVLGSAIFDFEFESMKGTNKEELAAYNYLIENSLNLLHAIFPFLSYIPFLEYNKNINRNLKILEDMIQRLVKESYQKISKGKKTSMLDFMVEANLKEKKLSDEELRDNIMIFFLAGHETTALALTWALYILASKKDVQQKVREEIDTIFGKEAPTPETIRKLKYLPLFIKEIMRMYSPVSIIPGRVASKNTKLGNYFIPKGTAVGISVHNIHHSPKIYEDPEVFRPERWTEITKKHIYNHVPFGGGSRICLGNNFSLIEQQVFLVLLLQKFELSMEGKVEIDNGRRGMFLMMPIPKEIVFTLRK